MKKIFFTYFIFIFLISFISSSSIGTFPPNEDLELYNTCNNCTSCNFTAIKSPNGTNILTNVETTRDNTYYNYSLNGSFLNEIGTYKYCYNCGNSVESLTGCIDFGIGVDFDTPTGLVMFGTFLILMVTTIFFLIFGIMTKNVPFKIFFVSLATILMVTTIGFSVSVFQQVFGNLGNIVETYGKIFIGLTILLTGGGIGLFIYAFYMGIKSFYNNARGYSNEEKDNDEDD